ncbi:Nucleoside-diphosphate-sugar epimerase [Mucilaginibacter pineti]|uniref:Nucleoside-diphosphate-sugar epimerase n=1 Tax=Mucilaginibacter pineti TaxID=1391627 RepID=A0A1G6Z683_9SPHI|nr:NmrA family NAD(P)-binding protein [Mucilaginibacter pineti]SDD97336.1 Nucleoside-diphosphate-sugar epimerase [Mucilaginibacter pineti]
MEDQILLAGATGDLGGRIAKALIGKGAKLKAIVRSDSKKEVVEILKAVGVEIAVVDIKDHSALVEACKGATCVVSAFAGLRDVIVDAQGLLLEAAVEAGVPRFIPSDYSTDFTKLPEGENRNFDLRKAFAVQLNKAMITPTSVFNGAFAELLTYNIPLLDHKNKTITYWEKLDWKVDFTSMNDTAAFVAEAALDVTAPRYLRIASFQVSANDLASLTGYELKNMGTLADLDAYNKRERAAHPEGENELYAKWQQSMYMHSMFSAHNEVLDNDRYPDLTWSKLEEYIKPSP